MADNKFHMGRVLENVVKMKRQLPIELANQAQSFFLHRFSEQAWDDGGKQPWKEVKRRIEGTPEYKYPKTKGLSRRKSAILVRSGSLRRAVGNSIRQATFDRIHLTVPIPYAEFQNDGTDTIPKREFMGNSATLRKMQKELIFKSMDRIWQA